MATRRTKEEKLKLTANYEDSGLLPLIQEFKYIIVVPCRKTIQSIK